MIRIYEFSPQSLFADFSRLATPEAASAFFNQCICESLKFAISQRELLFFFFATMPFANAMVGDSIIVCNII
jgi:hypothetical protein